MKKLEPIHPSEILLEEFLIPMEISAEKLAEDIGVENSVVTEILEKRKSISPNIALRLSLYFGLSERFWINLQSRYDLEIEKDRVADKLKKEVRSLRAA